MESVIDRAQRTIAANWPKRVYSPSEIAALDSSNRFPTLDIAEALVSVGVLEKKVVRQCRETGFLESDGYLIEPENLVDICRYEVVGHLMKLIDDLKNTAGAEPYFVSFHSAGGKTEATVLHNELQAAGLKGFLSDELQTGAQYRRDILDALRNAGTVILVESLQYHTRARCIVERDYAVAAGSRVLRVGLCKFGALQQCPNWLNENIQYSDFATSGSFDLNRVLAQPLSIPVTLHIRKRGAVELANRLTPASVLTLATKLGVEGQLHGSDEVQRSQLVSVAFASATEADRFCAEIDLLPMF